MIDRTDPSEIHRSRWFPCLGDARFGGRGNIRKDRAQKNWSGNRSDLKRFPLPILDRDVPTMWRLTPVLPEPAADPTDVKRIKAAVGIPRQTSSPRHQSPREPPDSPTERRRARQSGQNQEARSSVLRWRRGAARQAGTHSNRVARPIFQTACPLQRLVGELVDEDLFVSQVESETVDVHGIDLFGSPAAPALSRQRCCLSKPAPEGIVV